MINKDLTRKNEGLCNQIAGNILADGDCIASCINDAKHATASAKQTTSSLLGVRVTRHFAFEKFMTAFLARENGLYTTNIISIMDELDDIAKLSSLKDTENVITLQLTGLLDKYICSLPEPDRNIYIHRYFFADSLEDIAKLYNISVDNVNDIIEKCNSGLVELISEKKYTVKKETLFEAFTDVSDDLILCRHSGKSSPTEYNNKQNLTEEKKSLSLLLPITACGAAILLMIFILWAFRDNSPMPANSNDTTNNEQNNGNNGNNKIDPAYEHLFIKVEGQSSVLADELLAYSATKPHNTNEIVNINVDNITTTYKYYSLSDHSILKYCVGEKIEYFQNDSYSYYKLLGHDDMQYIIENHGTTYRLCKLVQIKPHEFVATDETGEVYNITYGDYLKQVHNIHSPKDIACIKSTDMYGYINDIPSIGATVTNVTDELQIEAFITTIQNIKFTTTSLWTNDNETTGIPNSIKNTSVLLEITTTDGVTLCNLFYDTATRTFFGNDGTAFTTISEDAHYHLRDILKWPYDGYYAKEWNPDVDKLSPTALYKTDSISVSYSHIWNLIDGLCVSDWFKLQRLENDEWVDVAAKYTTPDKASCNPFAYNIYNYMSCNVDFNLLDTYGPLDNGRYRIITSACYRYTYNTDKHKEQLYYTEFDVHTNKDDQ